MSSFFNVPAKVFKQVIDRKTFGNSLVKNEGQLSVPNFGSIITKFGFSLDGNNITDLRDSGYMEFLNYCII